MYFENKYRIISKQTLVKMQMWKKQRIVIYNKLLFINNNNINNKSENQNQVSE